MAVHVDTLTQPWLWWQYLTAGFTHSPLRFDHILGNMLVLFFLGRDVEEAYGPKEFLRLYLVMVVFAKCRVERRQQDCRHAGRGGGLRGLGGDRRGGGPVCPEFPPPHAAVVLRHSHTRLVVGRVVRRLDMFGASGGSRRVERGVLGAPGRRRFRIRLLPAGLEPDAADRRPHRLAQLPPEAPPADPQTRGRAGAPI